MDEPIGVGLVESSECSSDGEAAFVGGLAFELIVEFFEKFSGGIVSGGELIDSEWDGGAADIGESGGLLEHFPGELSAVGEEQECGEEEDGGKCGGDAGEVSAAGGSEQLLFELGAIFGECEEADAEPVVEWREVSCFAAMSPEGGEICEEDFSAASASFALFAVDPGADGFDEVIVCELPCWF